MFNNALHSLHFKKIAELILVLFYCQKKFGSVWVNIYLHLALFFIFNPQSVELCTNANL